VVLVDRVQALEADKGGLEQRAAELEARLGSREQEEAALVERIRVPEADRAAALEARGDAPGSALAELEECRREVAGLSSALAEQAAARAKVRSCLLLVAHLVVVQALLSTGNWSISAVPPKRFA
jgi:chromosome segregation ATPase